MSKMSGKLSGAGWGGLIGSVGGPLGAAIGAAIGGWIGHQEDSEAELREQMGEIFSAIVALYAGAAHSNNVLHPKERERIRGLASEFSSTFFPDAPADTLKQVVEEIMNDPPDHDTCARIFASLHPDFQPMVFRGALSVLAADGTIDDHETNWLSSLVAYSQSDPDIWTLNFMFYSRQEPQSEQAFQEAASLLGVSFSCTESELKKAWRTKVADYHPDRLMSLPDAVRKLAEDETRKVNEAYEILSRKKKKVSLEGLVVRPREKTIVDAEKSDQGQIVFCFLCDQKNRLPSLDKMGSCRCGKCYSLLSLPRELAEFTME